MNEWFENNVSIERFPVPTEIANGEWDYIINVSDEWILLPQTNKHNKTVKHLWFPMNEHGDDIGLNSIYGAMIIMHQAQEEGAKVLLHCHAGVNRSQTVGDCYWYMTTKEHRVRPQLSIEEKTQFDKLFGGEESLNFDNTLLMNCHFSKLPSIRKMEVFLDGILETVEQKMYTNRAGCLDVCKMVAKNVED